MLLGKRKISNGSLSISLGIDYSDQVFNAYIGEKSFRLTQGQHRKGEYPNYIRKTGRTGSMTIGRKMLRDTGLLPGDTVAITEKDGELLVALVGKKYEQAEKQPVLSIQPGLPYKPNVKYDEEQLKNEGNKYYFRIPAYLLDKADIEKDITVKINNNDGMWLEISSLTDPTIEGRTEVYRRLGRMAGTVDGLAYRDIVIGLKEKRITIPKSVRDVLVKDKANDRVKLWFNKDKGCIVVEAPSETCDIGDEEVRSLPAMAEDLDVCPNCLNEISAGGMLREILKATDQIAIERQKLEELLKLIS